MADSTLGAIRTKVRRLTRSPSASQLTDAQIDEYVNTFVLYDFPEHLRLFDLRTTLTFYTEPFKDIYETTTTVPTDPLFNFKNKYISIHPPVYIAGYQIFFSQSREQFFQIYPITNSIASIGTTGDGVTVQFTGQVAPLSALVPGNLTQKICLLKNQVLFDSIDINGNGLAMVDVPISNIIGNLTVPDVPLVPPFDTIQDPNNFINYATGQFVVTFLTAPAIGTTINSQTVPNSCSLPQAMCYYDDKFILRPVPDQPYRVNLEVYIRPTELLAANQSPDLEQYWQWMAYGGAMKVFQDRMDLDSVQLIMPEYKKQETLVLRKTIVQYTNERTATIYTEQTGFGTGSAWGFGTGWGPF